MKLFIDGQPIESGATTLRDALTAGAAGAKARGRIVVEVHADGAQVPDEHLADPPADSPYASEINLVTAEPKPLVRYTLNDAADALSIARERQSHAANMLRTGQMQQAMDALSETLAVWDMVRRALHDGCSLLGMPIDEALSHGRAAGSPALTEGLSLRLGDVKRAMGAEDWSSLADTLTYDLDEEAKRWSAALTGLAASIV